ncbi:hypothetical protein B9J78_02340 [bacterium Unc6]|nr:hypothetical protein [bacterium Unc6]
MNYQHKQLASGKWFKLTFYEQMANIGSEVERAILWREKNTQFSLKAIYRALELLDLTISDTKNCVVSRLKELCRLREILVDCFCFDNYYSSTDEFWRKYFYPFYYAARKVTNKFM